MTVGANAAITAFADSSTFDYKYEMDVNPSGQDLDSNGGIDWYPTAASGVIIPQTYAGGLATSNQGAGTPEVLFRGDFADGGNPSIWREVVSAGAAADWTMEIRISKVSVTPSADGWFGIATANSGESNSLRLNIEDNQVSFDADKKNAAMVGTDFTTGSHTIRIAHDAIDNANYIWINGTLLNTDLSTAIAGSNGSAFDNNTFIGDFSNFTGDWSVDYIRIDNDALGVIPEPSTSALLGLGCLTLLMRRRK